MKKLAGLFFLSFALLIAGCDPVVVVPDDGFKDSRDNHVYKFVTIGTQTWMAENLAYLPSVSPSPDGENGGPFYYVYGYEGRSVSKAKGLANYKTYGALYNWEAAKISCPDGWHLPSDAEWKTLTDYLGGEQVAGGKLKETGTTHWESPNVSATNDVSFRALPGGCRNYGSDYIDMGQKGYFQSSGYWDMMSFGINRQLYNSSAVAAWGGSLVTMGLSVRCIKDE